MSTKAYMGQPDWSLTPKGEVEETGTFQLPFAAACKKCRSKGYRMSFSYPWIDPKVVCSPRQRREIESTRGLDVPISLDQWVSMTKPFRDALAPEWPLGPCSSFGHFAGKAFGVLDDVVLTLGSRFLVRSSVCSKMIADGFEFLHFPACLKARKPLKETYVEVWMPPIAKSLDLKVSDYCSECSGTTTFLGDSITIPTAYANAPAFNARYHPVRLLLSENLVEWARKHGITGVNLKPEPLNVTWV